MNRDLHKQISQANDSITANMVEGFEQGTDRVFANFLVHSKASLAEVSQAVETGLLETPNLEGGTEPAGIRRRRARQDARWLHQILRRSDWDGPRLPRLLRVIGS